MSDESNSNAASVSPFASGPLSFADRLISPFQDFGRSASFPSFAPLGLSTLGFANRITHSLGFGDASLGHMSGLAMQSANAAGFAAGVPAMVAPLPWYDLDLDAPAQAAESSGFRTIAGLPPSLRSSRSAPVSAGVSFELVTIHLDIEPRSGMAAAATPAAEVRAAEALGVVGLSQAVERQVAQIAAPVNRRATATQNTRLTSAWVDRQLSRVTRSLSVAPTAATNVALSPTVDLVAPLPVAASTTASDPNYVYIQPEIVPAATVESVASPRVRTAATEVPAAPRIVPAFRAAAPLATFGLDAALPAVQVPSSLQFVEKLSGIKADRFVAVHQPVAEVSTAAPVASRFDYRSALHFTDAPAPVVFEQPTGSAFQATSMPTLSVESPAQPIVEAAIDSTSIVPLTSTPVRRGAAQTQSQGQVFSKPALVHVTAPTAGSVTVQSISAIAPSAVVASTTSVATSPVAVRPAAPRVVRRALPGAMGQGAKEFAARVGGRAASLSADFVDPEAFAELRSELVRSAAVELQQVNVLGDAKAPQAELSAASSAVPGNAAPLAVAKPTAPAARAVARALAQSVAQGRAVGLSVEAWRLINIFPEAAAEELGPLVKNLTQNVASEAGRSSSHTAKAQSSLLSLFTSAQSHGVKLPAALRGGQLWPTLSLPTYIRLEPQAGLQAAAELTGDSATPLWQVMPAPVAAPFEEPAAAVATKLNPIQSAGLSVKQARQVVASDSVYVDPVMRLVGDGGAPKAASGATRLSAAQFPDFNMPTVKPALPPKVETSSTKAKEAAVPSSSATSQLKAAEKLMKATQRSSSQRQAGLSLPQLALIIQQSQQGQVAARVEGAGAEAAAAAAPPPEPFTAAEVDEAARMTLRKIEEMGAFGPGGWRYSG